jgi:hypothetical protein
VQGVTSGPGPGFTSRIIPDDADIVGDEFASATGSYSTTAPAPGGSWIMKLVAFKLSPTSP